MHQDNPQAQACYKRKPTTMSSPFASEMVLVYRFTYWDHRTATFLLAEDYALERAIDEIGARIQRGTAKAVHNSMISRSGYLMA